MTDWSALDNDIDEFVAQFSLAPGTTRNHTKNWGLWEQHCSDHGVDPMAAPYETFVDLVTTLRLDGHSYGRAHFDAIVAAVTARYSQANLVPACKRVQHAGDWATLLKAVGVSAGKAKAQHPEAFEQWQVRPLLRDDLVSMLAAESPRDSRIDARIAAALLAWDHGWAGPELARFGVAETELVGEGVRLAGQVIACDHEARVAGVPWDCTACVVRRVVLSHNGDGALLAAASHGSMATAMYQLVKQIAALDGGRGLIHTPPRRAPGPGKTAITVAPKSALTQYQNAGIRRAIALAVGRREVGLRWVRARAWVALAWVGGFRMCGDLLRLPRTAVAGDPEGRGLVVELGGTKDDPSGAKRVVRALPYAADSRSAASFVAEYLCIRDALRGPGGFLLTRMSVLPRGDDDWGLADAGKGAGGGTNLAKSDLGLLVQLAGGLNGARYSSYSTRKGFAEQARMDGWSVEEISHALRHRHLGVVLDSYLAGLSAQDVNRRLLAAMEGRHD
ncbi:hypothetical protein ACFQW6_00735 [Nocardioides sp. GCM10028917]|uniref:hypothetical protein n=1 Tax=Nocardioides sp. GCM10028917 TaxID=3273408 RepID=UPI00360FF886